MLDITIREWLPADDESLVSENTFREHNHKFMWRTQTRYSSKQTFSSLITIEKDRTPFYTVSEKFQINKIELREVTAAFQ